MTSCHGSGSYPRTLRFCFWGWITKERRRCWTCWKTSGCRRTTPRCTPTPKNFTSAAVASNNGTSGATWPRDGFGGIITKTWMPSYFLWMLRIGLVWRKPRSSCSSFSKTKPFEWCRSKSSGTRLIFLRSVTMMNWWTCWNFPTLTTGKDTDTGRTEPSWKRTTAACSASTDLVGVPFRSLWWVYCKSTGITPSSSGLSTCWRTSQNSEGRDEIWISVFNLWRLDFHLFVFYLFIYLFGVFVLLFLTIRLDYYYSFSTLKPLVLSLSHFCMCFLCSLRTYSMYL